MRNYSLNHVFCTLGARRIEGTEDTDESIAIEFISDISESKVAADGKEVVVSHIRDPRATLTLSLMEGTIAYKAVAGFMAAQQAAVKAGTAIPKLPFLLNDALSGDKIREANATFQSRPKMSKGKVAGAREFVILLPNAGDNVVWGDLISES